ncbi:MAG: RNA-protein complex protein Nop10 [Promethearchaeota archaeon]|nr:MAG: RNA-protein complex protein Nop10 [Candidatus Lokiarchaeota archaeon]
MGKLLRRCVQCGRYSMVEQDCPDCSGKMINPQPPRFSLMDKYGKYRRELKKRTESS